MESYEPSIWCTMTGQNSWSLQGLSQIRVAHARRLWHVCGGILGIVNIKDSLQFGEDGGGGYYHISHPTPNFKIVFSINWTAPRGGFIWVVSEYLLYGSLLKMIFLFIVSTASFWSWPMKSQICIIWYVYIILCFSHYVSPMPMELRFHRQLHLHYLHFHMMYYLH